MPRNQAEDVNQSAKQLGDRPRDDAHQTETSNRRQRPQGIVKDQRGELQSADKKRAQKTR
jgi:hypothetical protein